MSESSHVPSLLISPTHDGMLGNWRSHGFILYWSRDWIRTNDLLGMSQTSYQLRYSAMKGLTTPGGQSATLTSSLAKLAGQVLTIPQAFLLALSDSLAPYNHSLF